jgi:hypothetical protein
MRNPVKDGIKEGHPKKSIRATPGAPADRVHHHSAMNKIRGKHGGLSLSVSSDPFPVWQPVPKTMVIRPGITKPTV